MLDLETPGWQEDSLFLLDNAPYHTSEETRAAMKALGMRITYSAAYSYDAAPIETMFSQLKLGELNPEKKATCKR